MEVQWDTCFLKLTFVLAFFFKAETKPRFFFELEGFHIQVWTYTGFDLRGNLERTSWASINIVPPGLQVNESYLL